MDLVEVVLPMVDLPIPLLKLNRRRPPHHMSENGPSVVPPKHLVVH